MDAAGTGQVGGPAGSRARRVAARALAAFGLAVWWVGMFGLIDLSTPFGSPLSFYPAYLLETGWGLLYTVLLGVPCLVLLARPLSPHPTAQLLVVAGALVVAALASLDPAQVLPASAAAGLGLGVRALATGTPRLPRGYVRSPAGTAWPALVVVAAGAVAAAWYAADTFAAARAGDRHGDVTNGLDHWPAQGAFALATVAVAASALLTRAGRPAAWQAAVCAGWFGALSVAYPSHAGSAGTVGGLGALAWAVVLVVTVEVALVTGSGGPAPPSGRRAPSGWRLRPGRARRPGGS